MGDQGKSGWVAGSAEEIRDSFNAALAACLPQAYAAEEQNARAFAFWLAAQAMRVEAVEHPTMGAPAGVAFFEQLSTPSCVAAWMDREVDGETLESVRAVLVRRFLEDDETQARIIRRARALAKNKLQDEQLERAEHGAVFQRLATAEVVEG